MYLLYNKRAVTWHTRKWEVAAQDCGFFHGECPIHETGRQVIRKTAYFLKRVGYLCLCVCPFVQIDRIF